MLIGLAGCKGSGKDTVGQYLIDNYGFTKIAFADKLKEAVANLFGLTVEQVDSMKHTGIDELPEYELFLMKMGSTTEWSYDWREFLQRFGTEMGRNTFGDDFWVERWHDTYHELRAYRRHDPDLHVVATDVRFPNEAHHINAIGGWIVEVTRPGYEPDGHASENPLPPELLTAELGNDGTIDDLYEMTDGMMEVLRGA